MIELDDEATLTDAEKIDLWREAANHYADRAERAECEVARLRAVDETYWQGRFRRMQAMYRERFNEGLSTEDWHRKHCGLMNAPEVTAETLAEVLAEHAYVPSGLRGVSRCACGVQFHGMPHDHRTHVAAAILARFDVRRRA